MLEAILKKNVDHDTFETELVLYAKTASKSVKNCFLSGHFVNGGHVGSHFEKKVDHDTFETELVLYAKNASKSVKNCFLSGHFVNSGHVGSHFEKKS